MEKILISACLMGEAVRYDGQAMPVDHPVLDKWRAEGRLVPFCPEVEGGLSVPRPAAEISNGDGDAVLLGTARVVSRDGADMTRAFLAGAGAAVAVALNQGLRFALLKENSPSCGSALIYDGSFTGKRVEGIGTATALLRKNGVAVFGESQIDLLVKCIN